MSVFSHPDNGAATTADAIDMALTGTLGSIGQAVPHAKTEGLEKQFAANLKSAFAPVNPENLS
jgi:hypothetical protein